MTAEIEMSHSAEEVEFPYRAVSSSAIASMVFAAASLVTGFFFWPALGFAIIGIAAGVMALRKIRAFPDEFDGKTLAIIGISLNASIVAAGAAMHSYIYLTEVPDGYSRVHFYELQQEETGPNVPTQRAVEINGDSIFLKGYIHPASGAGMLRSFILVPDLGTCCFGGQPKSTDMVEVTLSGGQTTKAGLRKKKLAGTFKLNPAPKSVTDFDNVVFYRMRVDQLK